MEVLVVLYFRDCLGIVVIEFFVLLVNVVKDWNLKVDNYFKVFLIMWFIWNLGLLN